MPRSTGPTLPLLFIRAHKPVTSQRIAHWTKDIATTAGRSGHHSVVCPFWVRGASTLATASKGVHVADILAVADWSRIPPSRDFITSPPQKMTAQKVLSH